MYQCKEHGEQETEDQWAQCDCSTEDAQRFSDLKYKYKDGERSIDIVLAFCAECGDPLYAHIAQRSEIA